MAIRVIRLGSPRIDGEGTRIGTVRRPPRGVPKAEFAARNWYDVWFPELAPRLETLKLGHDAKSPQQWAAFAGKYRREMSLPQASRALELLAALSHESNFSVGCYCQDVSRCHRSILRELFIEKGAKVL